MTLPSHVLVPRRIEAGDPRFSIEGAVRPGNFLGSHRSRRPPRRPWPLSSEGYGQPLSTQVHTAGDGLGSAHPTGLLRTSGTSMTLPPGTMVTTPTNRS